jgi:RNA polymerase sigma factor (sigma-70 family)
MTGNEMDAEDLLQMSFVDVFMKIDTFRFDSTIGAWIKRIMINNCINHIKRKKILFEAWNDHLNEVPDETDQTNGEVNHWEVNRVRKAIDQLPDGYRVVFTLYTLEGYDHQEIADILDITEATSKSQYSRAKKKLRSMISHDIVE